MTNKNQRQAQQKELLVEQLKKTPIIQLACEKIGLARATFYRWRKADPSFAMRVDESLVSGKALVNDMAESQLISAIKDKNLTAIIFWLKNHHRDYKNKLDISGQITAKGELSVEQKEIVMKALSMALIPQTNEDNE